MLTVQEVAQRLHRDPETIRRWIRSGKLPARKLGLQHVIEEADLPVADDGDVPTGWGPTATGEPMPDVVAALRRSRASR
ncbi:MAG: helix-turn-helix domain-containing protein [Mycobacteriales bacterium]